MSFTLALLIASVFWTGNGVPAGHCPHPTATQLQTEITGYDVPAGTYVAATGSDVDCTIDISVNETGAAGWDICSTIVHEVGHVRGLDHTPYDGIMAADPAGYVPEACDHPKQFRQWWHRHHLTTAEDAAHTHGWRRWTRVNFYP